jgi:hypothetical protein
MAGRGLKNKPKPEDWKSPSQVEKCPQALELSPEGPSQCQASHFAWSSGSPDWLCETALVVRGDVVTVEPPGDDILDWYGALADQVPSAGLNAARESVRRCIAAEAVRKGETS